MKACEEVVRKSDLCFTKIMDQMVTLYRDQEVKVPSSVTQKRIYVPKESINFIVRMHELHPGMTIPSNETIKAFGVVLMMRVGVIRDLDGKEFIGIGLKTGPSDNDKPIDLYVEWKTRIIPYDPRQNLTFDSHSSWRFNREYLNSESVYAKGLPRDFVQNPNRGGLITPDGTVKFQVEILKIEDMT